MPIATPLILLIIITVLHHHMHLDDFLHLKIKSKLFLLIFFQVLLQNQATYGEEKISRALTRDDNFNFRAAHWADLHSLLYNALPPDFFLWGHLFLSFCSSDDKTSVKVKTKVLQSGDTIEIDCDLLIAADGCLSSIRRSFLPNFKLRFVNRKQFGCVWIMDMEFTLEICKI